MFKYGFLNFLLALSPVLCAQDSPGTTIQGRVVTSDGSPVSGATVTFVRVMEPAPPATNATNPNETKGTTPPAGKETTAPPAKETQSAAPGPGQSIYVAVTGSGSDPGRYTLTGVPSGAYDIYGAYSGENVPPRKNIQVSGATQEIDFVLTQRGWSKFELAFVTLGVVLLFLLSVFMVRWNNISHPNNELLKAEIDKVRARFKSETGLDLRKGDAKTGYLTDLLEAAAAALPPRNFWSEFLFWSRGREMTAWSRIYEFQRDAIKLYPRGSLSLLRARLQAVELDLLDIDKTHAKTLASNIKDLLDNQVQDEPTLRAMLEEALAFLNDENDSSFAQLVGWQTKAVWLTAVGSVLIVVLAFAVGNAALFIAGASGGYLSRMARQLKRADVPSDYGASWTTLFLSPIMGALSAWFGLLLINLLADPQLGVLGGAFQKIQWGVPLAPLTLGLAFALGFSERLFDGIVSSLEDKVDSDRQAATQPKQPTSSIQPPVTNPPPAPTPAPAPAPVLSTAAPLTVAAPAPAAIAAGAQPASATPPRVTDTGRKAMENFVGLSRSPVQSYFRAAQDNPPADVPERPPLRDFDTKDIWPWIGSWLNATFKTDIEGLFVPGERKHAFTAYPATGEQGHYDLTTLLEPDRSIRIALAGDWGTGTDVAQQVTDHMVSANPELTIHLGDIYYVGLESEVNENCLGIKGKYVPVLWNHGSKGSFALNGNHEMYSGGNGYFQNFLPTLGIPTTNDKQQLRSYFCLETPGWRILAIDTGYNSDTIEGDCHLQPPLLDWLEKVIDPVKNVKPTVLLSHHQWFSAFEQSYPKPASQIAKFFQNQELVWLWGHEHRLAIYDRFTQPDIGGAGVDLTAYCRCMGHGGMPVELPDSGTPDPTAPQKVAFWDGDVKNRYIQLKDGTLAGPNGYVEMVIQDMTLTLEYWTVRPDVPNKSWKLESVLKESFTAGGAVGAWDKTLTLAILNNPEILLQPDN